MARDLTVNEFIDLRHLQKLQISLGVNKENQRLNLPSREKILGEIQSEIKRLEKIEKEGGDCNDWLQCYYKDCI